MTLARRTRWATIVLSAVVVGTAAVWVAGQGAVQAAAAGRPQASTMYYVAMGDSLAAGIGASSPSHAYVDLIYQHELARLPGLQLENLSCSGATTQTVLSGGGGCTYPQGSQLAAAAAFLESHSAQIAFVTIDIGANDVDSCVPGGTVDLACVEQGFANVKSQLPQILAGLQQADPGVQVFGMNYYDPFLAAWLLGSAGQQTARLSLSLSDTFNNTLGQIYGAYGFPTADAADAFAIDDLAPTGTYAAQVLPQNVANICNWTLMCSKVTIHANDTGHTKLATAFEQQIDGWYAGGGLGVVLASKGGGVYPLGNSLFYGALNSYPFAAPVVGIAALPSRTGYWLVAADGGVFTFGTAPFYGSMGGKPLNAPIVGVAAAPTGHGYWLVAADGGVFTFGTAPFYGSMGGKPLNAPIVGVAAAPTGHGYWLVAADGGVFTFGTAPFYGSMTTQVLATPVVGVAGT